MTNTADAIDLIGAYTHAAVRNDRDRNGPLATGVEGKDVLQEVHLRLAQILGPGYAKAIHTWWTRPRVLNEAQETVRNALRIALQRATSHCLRQARYRARQSHEPGHVECAVAPEHDSRAAPDQRPALDLTADSQAALRKLSDLERTIVDAVHERGRTYSETAADLGTSPYQVRKAVQHMRELLHAYWQE
jgi:DNA-directed RNA polymerase specialized sigma24 family protein